MEFGERITYELKDDHVAVLTINGVGPMNILDRAYYPGYNDAIVHFRDEDEARVLVITTDKDHFSAGADVKTGFRDISSGMSNMLTDGDMVTPKPIISAIKGVCIGDGFGVLLASDFVFADKNSKFACPETKLGFNAVTMQVKLTQRIGHNRTMEFMMGEVYDVEWLDKVGLCNKICDGDVYEQAMAYAHKIANFNGPIAVRGTKGSIWHTVNSNMDEAVSYAEWALEMQIESKDLHEGLAAYLEKRPPKFINE
jgi:enoyl-CoA hydratase/carnithine racemase